MAEADLAESFRRLSAIMRPYAEHLPVIADETGDLRLGAGVSRADGYEFAFGAVQIKKRYVSYHLVPVYYWPDLLDSVSAPLLKRMQGKSCFNFVRTDDALFDELAQLTGLAAERLARDGQDLGRR